MTIDRRCFALLIFCAATAIAQPTKTVRAWMDPTCYRNAPSNILLVLTVGDFMEACSITRENGTDFWSGDCPDSFPASRGKASIRFEGVRTGCALSQKEKVATGRYVALFKFDCSMEATRDIAISTIGNMDVRFERTLDPQCADDMTFHAGANGLVITAVRVSGEELRVQLARSERSEDPGLIVVTRDSRENPLFTPLEDDPHALVPNPFFAALLRKATKPCAAVPGQLCLTLDQLLDVFTKQGMQYNRTNSASLGYDRKRLETAGLKRVIFEVK